MATKFLNGIDAASQRIVSVADPSSAQDAATKAYVDNSLLGLQWKAPVRVASTATVTISNPGTSTFDGVALSNGDRILLKNQTTASQNGIYVFNGSGVAMTRATDNDSAAEMKSATAFVTEGSTNADKAFTQTAEVATLGTDTVTWVQFGAGTAYSAGNGLSLSTNTFSVLAADSSISVTGSGVSLASGVAGAGLTLTSGVLDVGAGTGISVAANAIAIDTAVVARKYAASIGNGSSTSIAVTHSLGTKDIQVFVRDNSTDANVLTDWVATDTNTVTLTFATAPTSNQYRVVVMG